MIDDFIPLKLNPIKNLLESVLDCVQHFTRSKLNILNTIKRNFISWSSVDN